MYNHHNVEVAPVQVPEKLSASAIGVAIVAGALTGILLFGYVQSTRPQATTTLVTNNRVYSKPSVKLSPKLVARASSVATASTSAIVVPPRHMADYAPTHYPHESEAVKPNTEDEWMWKVSPVLLAVAAFVPFGSVFAAIWRQHHKPLDEENMAMYPISSAKVASDSNIATASTSSIAMPRTHSTEPARVHYPHESIPVEQETEDSWMKNVSPTLLALATFVPFGTVFASVWRAHHKPLGDDEPMAMYPISGGKVPYQVSLDDVLHDTRDWDPAGLSQQAQTAPAELMYQRYRGSELQHGRLSMLAAIGFPLASSSPHTHGVPSYWPLVVMVVGVLEELMTGDQPWGATFPLPPTASDSSADEIAVGSWPSLLSLLVLAVGGVELALTGFQPLGVTLPLTPTHHTSLPSSDTPHQPMAMYTYGGATDPHSWDPAGFKRYQAVERQHGRLSLLSAVGVLEELTTGDQPWDVIVAYESACESSPVPPFGYGTDTLDLSGLAAPLPAFSTAVLAVAGLELALTGFQPMGVTLPTPMPAPTADAPPDSPHTVVGVPPETFCP